MVYAPPELTILCPFVECKTGSSGVNLHAYHEILRAYEPLADMIGGGPFYLSVEAWTDDTSMALCLATSLLDRGFSLDDQIGRYCKWHEYGYLK